MLEDNALDAELCVRTLKGAGLDFSYQRVETRAAFEAALQEFHPDLVLSDFSLPAYNGADALRHVREVAPDTPVIMLTGALGEEAAVELLNAGARDYVLKDRLVRLPHAIERVLAETELERQRRESVRLLRESEAKFKNILDHAPIGIAVAKLDGRIIEANQSLSRLLGYRRDALLKMGIMDLVYKDDLPVMQDSLQRLLARQVESFHLEGRFACAEGHAVWVQITASRLDDGVDEAANLILQVEDITERKRSQDEIRQLAYYDVLTGLPNRRLLLDRMNQSIAQAQRHQRSLAVMFFDLDHFKEINDTLGHDVGDELLKVVAERLEICVRVGDTVSRQGGDEFVIILSEIAKPQDAALVAQKILKVVGTPVVICEHKLNVTASIGVAVYATDSADDAARLMKKADVAMYEAKEAGRNTFRFYESTDET